jgi:hypothetical protein
LAKKTFPQKMSFILADIPYHLKQCEFGQDLAVCYEIMQHYIDIWFKLRRCEIIRNLSRSSGLLDLLIHCALSKTEAIPMMQKVFARYLKQDILDIYKCIQVPKYSNESMKNKMTQDRTIVQECISRFLLQF